MVKVAEATLPQPAMGSRMAAWTVPDWLTVKAPGR